VDRRCGRAGSSHRAPNKSEKRLVGRGDTAKACESRLGDQAYRRSYEERGHHYDVGEEVGSCLFRSVILRSVTALILCKARKTDEKRCRTLFNRWSSRWTSESRRTRHSEPGGQFDECSPNAPHTHPATRSAVSRWCACALAFGYHALHLYVRQVRQLCVP